MNRSFCPKCKTPTPPGALACTECGIIFSEWERQQADRLETLTTKQKKEIARLTLRLLWRPILVAATLISIVFGIGLWQTCTYINGQIQDKFAEPQVATTFNKVVTDAAQKQSEEILNNHINPIISDTKIFVDEQKNILNQHILGIRKQFEKELEEIKKENQFQKSIRVIKKLEDRAIMGSFKAYKSLTELKTENKELLERAVAASSFVKGYYVGKSRVSSTPLQCERADGYTHDESEMTHDELIKIMKTDKDQFVRARAAKLLREHRKSGVPEALLEIINNDESLWSRTVALSSFMIITGYKRNDVFGFQDALDWYEKNKGEVPKRLN